jgi:transposase
LPPSKSAPDVCKQTLKEHPDIEIVARDRAGAYADGIRQGAPEAIQVADRFHLLCNASDALKPVFDRHHREVRKAIQAALPEPRRVYRRLVWLSHAAKATSSI